MLKIQKQYIDRLRQAKRPSDLFPLVQSAIELEHSTIPPYLTAMISLHPGKNREIWGLIHSVVVEEMLHMTIAANVLNALGGTPHIGGVGFVPVYPGPLPMHIGGSLIVGLEPYSQDVVRNVFMEIEEPEKPINFPVAAPNAAALPDFATIGQFYHALQLKIAELPGTTLPGDPSRQCVNEKLFPADELFPIVTKDDAIRALGIIVEQGEGTDTSPLGGDGEFAHYYRFEELANGRRLVPNPSIPQGYSFSGPAVPFDPKAVYPLAPNTKVADLPVGSEQQRLASLFNQNYSRLLLALHRAFNGDPGFIESTLGLMFDIKLTGERLASLPYPGRDGFNVGPPFEWSPAVIR